MLLDSIFLLPLHLVGWILLGEVGEYGLNHIPAKNAACESGPEGSNPSLSANNTERSALGVAMSKESCAVLD